MKWVSIMMLAVFFFAGGCSTDKIVEPSKPVSVEPLGSANPVQIQIKTYDGSGQTVHPSVVAFSKLNSSSKYAYAITPYPGGESHYENPSVYWGANAQVWSVPAGLSNPVVQPFTDGYNSDPELVIDPQSVNLLMLFRQVNAGSNLIKAVSTSDLVKYSSERTLVKVPNHNAISPTAVAPVDGHPAMLWVVDAGPAGCRSSTSTLVMREMKNFSADDLNGITMGKPVTTDLVQPGRVVWHIAIGYVSSLKEYLAVYAAYPAASSCADNDLYLALSLDGVKWQSFSNPLMKRSAADFVAASLYRASFIVEDGEFKLWFSGFKDGLIWKTGYVEAPLEQVLSRLQQGGLVNAASASAQLNVPLRDRRVQAQQDLRKPMPPWQEDFP